MYYNIEGGSVRRELEDILCLTNWWLCMVHWPLFPGIYLQMLSLLGSRTELVSTTNVSLDQIRTETRGVCSVLLVCFQRNLRALHETC